MTVEMNGDAGGGYGGTGGPLPAITTVDMAAGKNKSWLFD